ncbi:hypothetical protein WJX74_001725 [Apatococcus lobatus]|uniref:glutathione transferase n=1 Tax=Apatococcus lobatus TaxID=904363 RepID=A0AAW1QM86_9CHLO
MTVTVHHLEQSRSQRIIWLFEELGIQYDIKVYKRNSKTMLAPPELLQIHPLGKSPVITDGSTTVAESGAIIEYLIRTYGNGKNLRPDESSPNRIAYDFWLHFAEGSAMTPILMALYFTKFADKDTAAKVKRDVTSPSFEKHVNFFEGELEKSAFFAGDEITGADINMSFPIETMAGADMIGKAQPKLSAWLSKIQARPAYKKALQRGGEENYQPAAFKSMIQ